MSYLVLARKYRPSSFDTVSGQEHVTKTFANAIKRDQVGHAHVLTGPRGVGKTSIARIFAKCLNCQEGPTISPCLECTNCTEIAAGRSLAVREIDGASNNSVDNIRELIESFRTLPAPGSKYKVYIIDEVHMLSISAFNALLKSLEEPPPNTVFLLATTEPHKIPDTVLSRCQRHDLRALPLTTVAKRLTEISKEEGLRVEPQAIKVLAKLSEGSMRDAQTLLERVRSYSDSQITNKQVSEILGTVNIELLKSIAEAIFSQDASQVLLLSQQVFDLGTDATIFLKELVTFFRDLHVVKICEEKDIASFGISADEYSEYREIIESVSASDISDLSDMARMGADKALRSSFPRYALESLLTRMSLRPKVRDMGKMIGHLRKMTASQKSQAKKPVAKKPVAKKIIEESVSSKKKMSLVRSVDEKLQEKDKGSHQSASPVSPPVTRSKTLARQASRVESLSALNAVSAIAPDNPTKEPPLSVAAQKPTAQKSSTEKLSTESLIAYLHSHGASIIAESVKMISVQKFEDQKFIATGSSFVISSLTKEDIFQRFRKLLLEFSKWSSCQIDLQESSSGDRLEPGSIQHSIEASEKQTLNKKKEKLLSSKPVKLVGEIFPGSKIESIRIKTGE